MPKKTVKKAARKTAKKTAAKKAVKKTTKKAAKKTAKKAAAKRIKRAKADTPAATEKPAPAIGHDDICRAAYLNFLSRMENGIYGDEAGDWYAAETSLKNQ